MIKKKNPFLLMISLISLLLIHPFVYADVARPFFYSIVLSFVVFGGGVSTHLPGWRRIEWIMGAAAITLNWLAFVFPQLTLISHLVLLSFFILTAGILIQQFIIQPKVDSVLLISTIDAYLLIGFAGSLISLIVYELLPGSFNLPVHFGNPQFEDFVYFSFVTLATLGYGDITPIHPVAQTLAILLTVIGQIYFAMVVALAISKYVSGVQESRKQEN
jgi:voltage-gated potassium channel